MSVPDADWLTRPLALRRATVAAAAMLPFLVAIACAQANPPGPQSGAPEGGAAGVLTVAVAGRDGRPLAIAGTAGAGSVVLHATNTEGAQIWSIRRPLVGGTATFAADTFPNLQGDFAAVVAVESPGYLVASQNVRVTVTASGAQVSPAVVHLAPHAVNPTLTVLLLIPALGGVIFALLHLTKASEKPWMTTTYANVVAGAWSAICLALIVRYVWFGEDLIPLFWPDFFVPTGVIIFSFLGTVTYVGYTVYEKPKGFYARANSETKRHVLLTIGGRILVAPYVALIGHAIVGTTFPSVRDGVFAAFFGFFAGLWIKVVLDALNNIGIKFLSAERQQQIADRMAQTTGAAVTTGPTTSSAQVVPSKAFTEAVAAARAAWLQKENVVGVVPGVKTVNDKEERVLTALVTHKTDGLPEGSSVPKEFHGFKTDVIALPASADDGQCSAVCSAISWKKIHELNLKRLNAATVEAQVSVTGQVIVIEDPLMNLVDKSVGVFRKFDVVAAYELARPRLTQRPDLVSFILDVDDTLEVVRDYHVPCVVPAEKGTNYGLVGNPGWYAEPDIWGANAPRACTVHSYTPAFQPYYFLHEFGHCWAAYAHYRDGGATLNDWLGAPDPTQSQFHWSANLVKGMSPMTSEFTTLEPIGSGSTFRRRGLNPAQDQFVFSELDLYLMGLLSSNQVPDQQLLTGVQTDSTGAVTGATRRITARQVIDACGQRVPAPAPQPAVFRQAFVVITRAATRGFAAKADAFRTVYENAFSIATRQLARVITTR